MSIQRVTLLHPKERLLNSTAGAKPVGSDAAREAIYRVGIKLNGANWQPSGYIDGVHLVREQEPRRCRMCGAAISWRRTYCTGCREIRLRNQMHEWKRSRARGCLDCGAAVENTSKRCAPCARKHNLERMRETNKARRAEA